MFSIAAYFRINLIHMITQLPEKCVSMIPVEIDNQYNIPEHTIDMHVEANTHATPSLMKKLHTLKNGDLFTPKKKKNGDL